MQTSINEKTALGIPGEHGNTQPWFADPVVVAADVTFGGLAGKSSAGKYGPMDGTTYTTYAGLFVSPHEHVRMVLPTNTAALTAPAGSTVAVAKKGAWYIAIASTETIANWKVGADVNYTTAGAITVASASGNTKFAEVLAVDTAQKLALIRFV